MSSGAEVSLRGLVSECFEARRLFFPPSLLVAVVSNKEAFLTTVRETTKDFSFHFPPPPYYGIAFCLRAFAAC